MLSATVVAAVVGVCWTFQHGAAPQRGTTRVWLASGYAEAVSAAEAASQKFGPTSQEAKAAWEAVSDLDDNDDQATAGIAADPAAVAAKLAELQELVSSSKPTLSALKVELSKIAGAKLFDEAAPVADASADVEALTKAAEAATAEFGASSPEAKSAWEAVEEMNDSTNVKVATIPGLDDECLTETIEKCVAFEAAMDSLETSIANLNAN
mmetsp:Transcript_23263/g.72867  ORF Transcript_23263/g.72867 Transcript_23263/m.72867 type:complete len:210 (+) Transcript_23263:40-669(+)